MAKSKKIFVVGTGRCGTVTINKLFQTVPNTFSMHEGVCKLKGQESKMGDLKEINKIIYYDSKNSKKAFQDIELLRGKNIARMDVDFQQRHVLINKLSLENKNYCDINPYQYNYIDYIIKHYPDAIFIHMIRDGYDVVKSYYQRRHSYPNIPESKYRGYQSGKPRPFPGDKHYAVWDNYDKVQKLSWFWVYVNSSIEKKLTRVSGSQRMLVKLEDFDCDKFENILEFCGLPGKYDQEAYGCYNKTRTKAKMEWDPQNIEKFNKIAKKYMRRCNYKVRI